MNIKDGTRSMDDSEQNSEVVDSGSYCLAVVAQVHQVAVDSKQIIHDFSRDNQPLNDVELQRAAKSIGFKSKVISCSLSELDNSVLPAIAKDKQGNYFVLAKIQQIDVPSVDEGGDNSSLIDSSELTNSQLKALILTATDKKPALVDESGLGEIWDGELILLSKRGQLLQTIREFDISWFIPAFLKYKHLFADVFLASFFLQLFALVTPLFFQVVMDKVLAHHGFSTLDVLAVGFFILVSFEAVLGGVRNYVFSHTTNRVDVELGSRLFKHITALPISFFEARQVGQTAARVRELDTIRNFITGSALTLCIDLLFTIVFFAFMWYYSPTLTIVVLLTIPLYVLLSVFITPILRNRLNKKFEHSAKNQAFLVESIHGIETIKASAVEPQMQQRWEEQIANYVNASFGAQHIGNIASQIAQFISKLTTLGILYFGAHAVINEELTVGQLIAFNMLAGRVSGPILKLVQLWQDFQQAGISVKRLGDILNSPVEAGFRSNRSTLPDLRGGVSFENVTFRYQLDRPAVLNAVSLEVSPGEVIGLVGRSGSGKSTLTKLVQRFYIPETGRVIVDGVDASMVDTNWLRRNIGVVLQENFLFNRTVRENIALSNPAASMEAVVQAAKLAGAHDFIIEMPDAYDSIVGEHGSNLSGGQRQRIAIARALITNPKILIFDEATSALDYESERIIQDNMESICQGRTVFIIAHRLSAVRVCDRIVVMDKGSIVEQGNHHDLINADGYYAKLNSYQSYD